MGMSERIKNQRIAMNFTQEELAQKLGLQKSAIAKYENGRVENIKRSVIAKMAEILECSPAFLMGWEDTHTTRLRDRRKELNLSVQEVANYINVTVQTIFRWESGLTETLISNKENVVLLADILQVSPFYILGLDVSSDVANDPVALEFYLNSNNKKSDVYSSDEISLIGKYRTLSDIGKKKARENIDDLSKIYTSSDKSYLEPRAAHERTDIKVTDEMRKHDDGIMDDDDFWNGK